MSGIEKIPGELVEDVLLYVDFVDIIRVQTVATSWRCHIEGSTKPRRMMHKEPTQLVKDSNLHFEDPTILFRDKVNKGVVPEYTTEVLTAAREIDRTYLATMREYPAGQVSIWDRDDYGMDLYDMRRSFQDVRKPNGWPEGLKQIHCKRCDVFHTPFRYQNMHPALRFLEGFDICFRGYDSQIFLEWKLFFDDEAMQECYDEYCTQMLEVAKNIAHVNRMTELDDARAREINEAELRQAGDKHTSTPAPCAENVAADTNRTHGAGNVQPTDKFGFSTDQLTRPLTKLVSYDSPAGYSVIENGKGLTVGQTLPYITRSYRRHLSDVRSRLHGFDMGARITHMSQTHPECDYPSVAEIDHFYTIVPEIVDLFEEVLDAVNDMMADVDGWEGVTCTVQSCKRCGRNKKQLKTARDNIEKMANI